METPHINGIVSNDNYDPSTALVRPVTANLMSSNGYITPEALRHIPTPEATRTHKPIPHYELNETLDEMLGYSKIGVMKTKIAVSKDGMDCYLVKTLDTGFPGGSLVIGARNSNIKRFALDLTLGYNVTVCDNGMFRGDFGTNSRKHTRHMNLRDYLSIRLHDAQRYFDPLRQDIERWRQTQLSENDAKLRLYGIFIEGHIDLPRHLARPTHEAYFNPKYEDFPTGSEWSFQNALTEVIKTLDPVRQQEAAGKIGEYFQRAQYIGGGAA